MKRIIIVFQAFCSILLFAGESYSWDYSEYQEKLKGLSKGELWDEFHKNLSASEKDKAYEAYLLYRPFDSFDSRSLLEEFEKEFGKIDYSKNDLSVRQDQEEADVILDYLKLSDLRKKASSHVVFSHSLVDFSKESKLSIDNQIAKTNEMAAEVNMCIRSFLRNNAIPVKISHAVKDAQGVILLSKEEYERLFKNKDEKEWQNFEKLFPGASGYFRFSKVGFDHSFQRAFFQVHVQPRPDGGFGELVYFEKINGKWQLISRRGIYIY